MLAKMLKAMARPLEVLVKMLEAMTRPIEVVSKMLEAMLRPIEVLAKMLEAKLRPIEVEDCDRWCCRCSSPIVYSIFILCFVRSSSNNRPMKSREALRPNANTEITMSRASVESMLEKEAIC